MTHARSIVLALALVAGLASPGRGWAEPVKEPPEPTVLHPAVKETREAGAGEIKPAAAVTRLLAQAYLTDDEKRDLRVFHGVWTQEDLDTPARRARVALVTGRWDDAALEDAAADALDRAEALLRRGEAARAAEAIDGAGEAASSARGRRLRGEAAEAMGKPDEAMAAIGPLLERLGAGGVASAEELTEAALALGVRARVRPQESPQGGDFQRINQVLARARQGAGVLHWPAYLAEARLMYERHNSAAAQEAVAQAISLNPRLAEGWALLGRMAVDSFAMDRAERIASRLDEMAGGTSGLAAVIRARAQMRQSAPETARQALDAASGAAGWPEVASLRVATVALSYDWGKLEEALAAFEARFPGSGRALLDVGRALSEARQYEQADVYLKRAAERLPYSPEPLSERGLMLIQAGRDAEAGPVLERALAMDPFDVRADNSLKLVRELGTFERVEGPHFVIRYKSGPDEVLAREMLPLLEGMHARVTGAERDGLDHSPAGKTLIDLMPSARWFATRIAGVTRIHTMAASTGPAIAMESPRVGPGHSVGTYDWLRVVRHEYVHTVSLSRTRNRIPHWFTEASAVFLEDGPRDWSTVRLLSSAVEEGALFDLRKINLAFVRPEKPTDRQQAYAQGHWMYEYIVRRWGSRAPLELMDRYAAGLREEAAFKDVLGLGGEEFLSAFTAWAGERVAEWGMTPRAGEPTVAEILAAETEGTDEARAALRERVKDRAAGFVKDAEEAEEPVAAEEGGEKKEPAEFTHEVAERWLEWYPESPELLSRLVRLRLKEAGNTPSDEMEPLLRRAAAARPVDPLPHQMLARLGLARVEALASRTEQKPGEAELRAAREAVVPHLEFLDAREQYSPVYAAELARLYQALGRAAEASAKAERTTIVAPFEAAYRELAATAALRAGDLGTARRHIWALTKIEPEREIHTRRLEAVEKRINAGG